ncbi:hypothetical protein [Sinomonas terrae]|uniref:Uncharacterized protein n=1 Tax=Sinomonas terrae TaxID=2908838 RepID=A0ABS9U044_9MICC|nr:hypothetical protein [Sinomonas terrae]MCH6470053.1 hypothetical protein [Sinomonas terrae]
MHTAEARRSEPAWLDLPTLGAERGVPAALPQEPRLRIEQRRELEVRLDDAVEMLLGSALARGDRGIRG